MQEAAGVVADARILGLDIDPGLVACFPYWELTPSNATVVARGAADTTTALAERRPGIRSRVVVAMRHRHGPLQ